MWDERYGGDEYAYGKEPNDFIREHASRLPAEGRVLCVAEGEGRNAVFLARQGFRVTAFDASVEGVNKTRRLAAEAGVEVDARHADARDFEVGTSRWDGVVSVFAHMPPDVRADLHRRIVDGLAPGGVLLLEAYNPGQLAFKTGGPPVAALCMTAEGLRSELAGLEFEFARELEREVVEGKYHHGMAAVVQVLARRP